MKAKIVTLTGAEAKGDVSLDKAIFGLELRKDILHRVVNWQLAKRQSGTHKTKERGEVSGSTRKLFKQKGTGNARTGSRKQPHKRGGGTAFGPRVRSHAHSLPKKIRSLGLKIALSSKQNGGKLLILQENKMKAVKTSEVAGGLSKLGIKSALIVVGETVDENFKKSIANIKHVNVLPVQGANVYDILRHENLLMTEDAIKKLEERLNA